MKGWAFQDEKGSNSTRLDVGDDEPHPQLEPKNVTGPVINGKSIGGKHFKDFMTALKFVSLKIISRHETVKRVASEISELFTT